MESSTTIALVACGFTIVAGGLGFATFWMTLSSRISDAKAKAEAASVQAKTATARAITTETGLNNLRVEVARDYVSNNKLDATEGRILEAVHNLGTRIDHAFANKGN